MATEIEYVNIACITICSLLSCNLSEKDPVIEEIVHSVRFCAISFMMLVFMIAPITIKKNLYRLLGIDNTYTTELFVTDWGRGKMAIFQTTFSKAFYFFIEIVSFRWKFH